jgi:hypothetical protein
MFHLFPLMSGNVPVAGFRWAAVSPRQEPVNMLASGAGNDEAKGPAIVPCADEVKPARPEDVVPDTFAVVAMVGDGQLSSG